MIIRGPHKLAALLWALKQVQDEENAGDNLQPY